MKVERSGLPQFARDVATRLLPTAAARGERATIVALSGDLGAGKTTFVQALARELGVADIVQSPTYVLMKSYDIQGDALKNLGVKAPPFSKLVHIDLYRLEKPEELAALKLGKVLADPRALVCIEWPERAEGKLPSPDLAIRFSSQDAKEDERKYEIL